MVSLCNLPVMVGNLLVSLLAHKVSVLQVLEVSLHVFVPHELILHLLDFDFFLLAGEQILLVPEPRLVDLIHVPIERGDPLPIL